MGFVRESVTPLTKHDELELGKTVAPHGSPDTEHDAAFSRRPLLVNRTLRIHCLPTPCQPEYAVDRTPLRRGKSQAGNSDEPEYWQELLRWG